MPLFIDNESTKEYFAIIKRAQGRLIEERTELHHIIPKSCGGGDEDDNLVALPLKDHYTCHELLVNCMVDPKHQYSMQLAFAFMTDIDKYPNMNAELYEEVRSNIVRSESHCKNIGKAKRGRKVNNPHAGKHMIGKKWTQAQADAHVACHTGRTNTEETKRKMSLAASSRTNRGPRSAEWKAHMSKLATGRKMPPKTEATLALRKLRYAEKHAYAEDKIYAEKKRSG